MNNLICLFFGHRIYEPIGKFATWHNDGYDVAEFRLCSRCKNYFINTFQNPRKRTE